MKDNRPKDAKPQNAPDKVKAAARQEKLAAQLRENLKKRKQLSRARNTVINSDDA